MLRDVKGKSMRKIITLIIFILGLPLTCFALNVDAHKELNEKIAEKNIQEFLQIQLSGLRKIIYHMMRYFGTKIKRKR